MENYISSPIHGHFDALMTIDLEAMRWAIGLLAAIKFFYLQIKSGLQPADPKTKVYHGKAVPNSMLMKRFVWNVCVLTAEAPK